MASWCSFGYRKIKHKLSIFWLINCTFKPANNMYRFRYMTCLFCKNVLLLNSLKKLNTLSVNIPSLLHFLFSFCCIKSLIPVFNIVNNDIIYHFQKYICFKLFHILLLTSALDATLRSLGVFLSLVILLLIKYYIADWHYGESRFL